VSVVLTRQVGTPDARTTGGDGSNSETRGGAQETEGGDRKYLLFQTEVSRFIVDRG